MKLILLFKIIFNKENNKLYAESCADILGECDSTRGLSCQGDPGAKLCLWVN